jgi:hypothetical protein
VGGSPCNGSVTDDGSKVKGLAIVREASKRISHNSNTNKVIKTTRDRQAISIISIFTIIEQ